MGSRKSIIREAIERLDSLMAIGQSRFQAKQAQRATSPDVGWTVSTGKIHSPTTRKVYQQHAPEQALPPLEGRLRRDEYDAAAAQQVSWALGHNRLDVVLRHYLR